MPDTVYEADLVLWAEAQARALRDAARGASTAEIDHENVAERILADSPSLRPNRCHHSVVDAEGSPRARTSPGAADPQDREPGLHPRLTR